MCGTSRLHSHPTLERSVVALALLAAGCGADFDPPSKIDSLRILAVQKDKPYARPGDVVKYRMLLADDRDRAGRRVSVTWLSACENPLGDLYAGCFVDGTFPPREEVSPLEYRKDGLEVEFKVSSTILSRRPPPVDRRQPPYGLSVVYFAACAGDVGFVLEGADFPITCTKGGKPVGAEGFVVGYTQTFVYDAFTNANPVVKGFEVDGEKVTPECIGDVCVRLDEAEFARGGLPAGDAGSLEAGAPEAGALEAGASDGDAGPSGAPSPCDVKSAACIDVCTRKDSNTCKKHDIELVLDEKASTEHNSVVEAREGKTNYEQSWVNYYADGARILGDVKLLSDATYGWNDDHETELREPKTPGFIRVWAVAHDNRSGADWARVVLEAK